MSITADLPAEDADPGEARHLSVVRSESDIVISRLCELAGHLEIGRAHV